MRTHVIAMLLAFCHFSVSAWPRDEAAKSEPFDFYQRFFCDAQSFDER